MSGAPLIALDHEQLLVRRGRRSGVHMAVAVHSTALGPALGGVRIWHYPSEAEGIGDALRLSGAMTLKAAAAGLDLGGGKGVVCAPAGGPPTGRLRESILLDFGELVDALGGAYICAEDVGSSAEDLVTIRQRTANVAGLPPSHGGSGDPSPYTARGVEAAMRACARARFGSPSLEGARVTVVGLGHVGARLARRLAADGAYVIVSDVDDAKRRLAVELGAEWVGPGRAITAECDIVAPCALGGAIDAHNVGALSCDVICGAANNQLAEQGLDERLAARGVLYAPDFIANAGGLISVSRELSGCAEEEALTQVDAIESAMDNLFAFAATRSQTPLQAATSVAAERLAAAARAESPEEQPAPRPDYATAAAS